MVAWTTQSLVQDMRKAIKKDGAGMINKVTCFVSPNKQNHKWWRRDCRRWHVHVIILYNLYCSTEKPRPDSLALAFQKCKPGQSRHEAVNTARLGLAYLGSAWPGLWPQAGPCTALCTRRHRNFDRLYHIDFHAWQNNISIYNTMHQQNMFLLLFNTW